MAASYTLFVYPSNIDSLTVTLDNETTLSYSDFTRNIRDDYLYYYGVGSVEVSSAITSDSYPAPRITEEVDTSSHAEPWLIIDFRPQHLYAIGDVDNDPNGYVYVDDLTNPTGVYNIKGWSSNNAFDWSWKSYSNFYGVLYNSSTGKYDITCTEATDPHGGGVTPIK